LSISTCLKVELMHEISFNTLRIKNHDLTPKGRRSFFSKKC
jgi:hypothetical protein